MEENTALIDEYADCIDMVELRADFLDVSERSPLILEKWLSTLAEKKTLFGQTSRRLPVIFTLRLPKDGGLWKEDIDSRKALLIAMAKTGLCTWIDIESDAIDDDILSSFHEETTVIISDHYFDEQSSVLSESWYKRMIEISRRYPQAIVKAAISCNSTQALCDFFSYAQILHREIPGKFIAVPMGVFGLPGRVLSAFTHSMLCFSSEEKDGLAHLGQVSPRRLVDTYNYRAITEESEIYAIVGNPVMHSHSPHFHNALFAEKNAQNKIYIHLPTDDISVLPRLAHLIPLRGLSITIPHKGSIIPLLSAQDEMVSQCRSCNTVLLDNAVCWRGFNTDIQGFLEPLYARLGNEGSLRGYKVSVIGAGGTAKALSYALRSAGAQVLIVNRTLEKAVALSKELVATQRNASPVSVLPLAPESYDEIAVHADIIVQTSSVGMNAPEESPLLDFPFTGKEIVYDVIYTPLLTKLMRDAKDKGCIVISGEEMFIAQGKLQSELFMREM